MRGGFNWLIDVAAVTVTVVVGVVVTGRFLESDLGRKLDDAPVVGDLWVGLRNAWGQVYDPSRLP